MTRRRLIRELVKAGSVIVLGASWLANKATPRRFVRAVRLGKYPGLLKPLRDISEQSKWSG